MVVLRMNKGEKESIFKSHKQRTMCKSTEQSKDLVSPEDHSYYYCHYVVVVIILILMLGDVR